MVEDHITIWASVRKGLAQLLDDPLRTGMSSHVAVQDPTAPVLDDKKQYSSWKLRSAP